jgi:peptidoglycan/xylan/chitin deacetylase (PgdA/CDA1 family)
VTTRARVTTAARPAHEPKRRTTSDAALDRLIRVGLPLYCGGSRGRSVALTFDDGPGPYTKLALRMLRLAHARATFFLVGRNLAGWPDVPRHELRLGALGDHTWTHAFLIGMPASSLHSELARTQAGIARAGSAPVRLFRPPYGARDAAVDAKAHALGMLEVLWSIDSNDSQGADYLQIARNVLSAIRPGSIVLLHENRGQTLRALNYHILPALHRRRLKLVSVPELLAHDPPTRAQLRAGAAGC